MQRSRRALLQRKVLENSISVRQRLYNVSLSIVLALWMLVLFQNLWIVNGDDYAVRSSALSHESTLNKMKDESNEDYNSRNRDLSEEINTSGFDPGISAAGCDGQVVTKGNEAMSMPNTKQQEEVDVSGLEDRTDKEAQKTDRLSRVAPPGLDEFKNKAIDSKGKSMSGHIGNIVHRVEPNGKSYNYASDSKGAKVLDFNKEAKGASNILDKDKDKYLRNPCSAEEKFVIIELSEETLVDTIEIANFEHYSSNLKDFELQSSLVYPTDNWVKLGNFTAGNVKHVQRFTLTEPKWARYLKLNLLSHYGFEFYCTLSVIEVYGVDVVERMLEDLMSSQENQVGFEDAASETAPTALPEHKDRNEVCKVLFTEFENEPKPENLDAKSDLAKASGVDSVKETKPQSIGRAPSDSVLKILMQKIRSLNLNFAVLERYLEELNIRYGNIFKEFDNQIALKDVVLQKLKLQMQTVADSKEALAKDVSDLITWRSLISSQLDKLIEDNAILRFEIERVLDNQNDMEKKGLAVIFVSFSVGCFAALKLFVDMLGSVCRIRNEKSGWMSSVAWPLLVLSSSIILFILMM